MKSQTERPTRGPNGQRPPRSNKPKHYNRQTARGIEAKRDGKPLIFGWGKHLSHKEKIKVQRRAVWGFTALVGLVLVAVLVGTWINFNIIIPGQTITTVNGHKIPQSEFRKMVALQTLLKNNDLNGRQGLTAQRIAAEKQDAAQLALINTDTKTVDNLNAQIKALPAGPGQKRTDLESQLKTAQKALTDAQSKHSDLTATINTLTQTTIPLEQQVFQQLQVESDSATWLQDDELIREWLANQSVTIQNKINPSSSQVNHAINDLQANTPTTTTYSKLLSQIGVSNDDIQSMMIIKLRRDNMQNYLSSQIVSPAYQVLARSMTIATLKDAKNILKQLQADHGSDFGKTAKAKSQDSGTASSGGDLGWLARGQYAQSEGTGTVDNWIFNPARYINEISPVLQENGTYRIVQIMAIDPSRVIDSKTLQSLQTSALSNWLFEMKALPSNVLSTPDANMMTDANNLPPTSILPAFAPSSTTPGGPSLQP
ncbi:MAG TPA: peptidylprolyl isomerase [Ktedonobacteraceae bacterium]|nr:peptidylprolyl isomerase [Ktedonobacteraceae bacterium]